MNLNSNTDPRLKLTENRSLDAWFEELAHALRESRQRVLVVYQGSRASCLQALVATKIFSQTLILSNQQDVEHGLPFSKAETLLGSECDCVVMDLYSGMQSDVFCLAAGLVRAGGALVLLRPVEGMALDDPYGCWQNLSNQHHYFNRYLGRHLHLGEAVVCLQESHALPDIPIFSDSTITSIESGQSAEQALLMQELMQWSMDSDHPWFLLTADRGRGKSTLLGLFVNQQDAGAAVTVTAASKAHAANLLAQLDERRAMGCFVAPDELIRLQRPVDLLVIDEAAMLPLAVLMQCMALAKKTLMATTTGGYEGTGQGFLLKLKARLDENKTVHRQLMLPIRWGKKDLLEPWLYQVMLLKSVPQQQIDSARTLQVRTLSQQELFDNEGLLQSVYGLLVNAHYRTRPSDLRQLMEDPNLVILTAQSGDAVVAVCLLNREGGFDAELCEQVYLGKRRPQGHLFAQMLTAQAGARQFAMFKGLRVQRITVDSRYRRQGVGRQLIAAAEDIVKSERLDYLGSTFAVDYAVTPFWEKLGFQLVHIGSGRGKSTGRQAIAVINTQQPELQGIIDRLVRRIADYLPVWMLAYCRIMYWRDVQALLGLVKIRYRLTDIDVDEIHAFSSGFRGFDLSLAALQKLVIMQLPRQSRISEQQQQCLIDYVLMNKRWQDWKGSNGEHGQKALERLIRPAIGLLYETCRDDENDE